MDKYSRLLVTFKTVDGNIKDDSIFLEDLQVLKSPAEDLLKLIKDDLHIILPAILNLSVNEEFEVRAAIAGTYDTFQRIIDNNPPLKLEPWWKDMEVKLIAGQFSQKLIKMVEVEDKLWVGTWVFATTLIVHEEHVHGVAMNSLLKVVETAFKMSKRNDAIMEKAYYCWNQLIDVFSKHPRVVCSQKLVELLVRPLSTTNLSFKCPNLKMQTWQNLMRKVGFTRENKCTVVINPFIDFMYLKGDDSLCLNFPMDCLKSFAEILEQKKIYRFFALKVLSAFPNCYETCSSEDHQDILVNIWKNIIGNTPYVDKNIQSEYILQIFNALHQVLQHDRPELNSRLMKIFVDQKMCINNNLRICASSELPLISMFSVFMNYEDFRSCSFPIIVKDLMGTFSNTNIKKPQNNIDLQLWDLLCDMYVIWFKSASKNASIADHKVLTSLLMIPFVNKQWSVAVQKTWFNLVDSVHCAETGKEFLCQLMDKISEGMKESHISASTCIEICTHLINNDKGAFKDILPVLNVASSYLPSKDSKPLLDMLVILENAVGHVPKSEMMKFLNELMIFGNKYEHPYGLRIKTKISKIQRKLFTLKENTEADQETVQQNKSDKDEQQSSCSRNRSPIIAQSNFLQRLAKAEEKKKKKCPSMASIFGESAANQEGNASDAGEKSIPERAQSPAQLENKEVTAITKDEPSKDLLEPPLVNGRCSPVIPQSVQIVTPTRCKRPQAKSPDKEIISQSPNVNKKKVSTKKSPAPPSYFEDDAQDYVFVPPKAKTTPLTEHQKELFSKRRTDIPALYQDLSQDTQSDSQSLKEITVLKDNQNIFDESAGKATGNDVKELSNTIVIDETINSEKMEIQNPNDSCKPAFRAESDSNPKDIQKPNQIVENGISDANALTGSKFQQSNSKQLENDGIDLNSKKADNGLESGNKTELRSSSDEHKNEVVSGSNDKAPDISDNLDSQEIIESTPQLVPTVSLNLTPTKSHGQVTPRNLISRMKLLENDENSDINKKSNFIDEEEEFEKENIIKKSRQNTEKTPINSQKKRSLRYSGKLIPKKNEGNFEGNLKYKKENAEGNKSTTCIDDDKVENKLNNKLESSPATDVVVDDLEATKLQVQISGTHKEPEESKSSNLNSDIAKKDCELTRNLVSGEYPNEAEMKNQFLEESTVLSVNSEVVLHHTSTQSAKVHSEKISTSENSKEINKITNNNELINGSSEVKPDCISKAFLPEKVGDESMVAGPSDDNSESPSTIAVNWAMTTPAKRGRKKKGESIKGPSEFSPKQLRSKRLSLSKNQRTPEQSTKKMRKSAPSTMPEKIKSKLDNDKSNITSDEKASPANKSSDSETSVVSPNDEANPPNTKKRGRKRKNPIETNEQVEEKKSKSETQPEEANQDSVLVVKNNTVKPRKKKIIKSNIKQSPSNLELWLLKTGKTVVKTSLISQENSGNEHELTMIEDSADIQINVGDSKNVVVEIPSTSSPKENINNQNPSIVIVEASPELPSDSNDDILNCTRISDSPSFRLNLSEEEGSSKLNESVADIPSVDVECHSIVDPNSQPSSSNSVSPSPAMLPSSSEVIPSNSDPVPSTSASLPSTPDDSNDSIGLRAHRRKRRFLRRELTPSREIPGTPEDENFENKRERLTTPFRPALGSSGRSAQMVMMATGDDEQEPRDQTPVRRKSIPAVRLTDNWPEGRLEDWVPCVPTPPGRSPSRCILRRKPPPSPSTSPSSSPSVKKKRVSFLDPPVSKGLLYCKGETLGQIQHADIPEGEKPLWRDEDESEILTPQRPTSRSMSEDGSDEMTAIQEFLNSTPDAPWSKTIPPELDVRKIVGLESRNESIEELIKRLTDGDDERNELHDEIKKLNVFNVADIRLVSLKNLNRLCSKFLKVKSLAKITEEYVKEKVSLQMNVEPIAEPSAELLEHSEESAEKLNSELETASPDKEIETVQLPEPTEENEASHKIVKKNEINEAVSCTENNLEENLMEVDVPEPILLDVDETRVQPIVNVPEIDKHSENNNVLEDAKRKIESEKLEKHLGSETSDVLADIDKHLGNEASDILDDIEKDENDAEKVEIEAIKEDEAPLLRTSGEVSDERRKEELSEKILELHDRRNLELVIPQLLDDSTFVEVLARHANLAFLARLVTAMNSIRPTPD